MSKGRKDRVQRHGSFSTACVVEERAVLWMPSRNEISDHDLLVVEHLEDGFFNHPVLVLWASMRNNKAIVMGMTSFKEQDLLEKHSKEHIRRKYLPIHPSPPHPDNGMVLLLENMTKLRKKSYINISRHHELDSRLFRSYSSENPKICKASFAELLAHSDFRQPPADVVTAPLDRLQFSHWEALTPTDDSFADPWIGTPNIEVESRSPQTLEAMIRANHQEPLLGALSAAAEARRMETGPSGTWNYGTIPKVSAEERLGIKPATVYYTAARSPTYVPPAPPHNRLPTAPTQNEVWSQHTAPYWQTYTSPEDRQDDPDDSEAGCGRVILVAVVMGLALWYLLTR
ncbi:hypothetical protein EJ06DRAFT_556420 [Trichodelitschia bisporula]|uniref:Uncharacterized protein n=1 Tax=Trichodelitschia bisporula TaxID=703511 RepID=A0A6G1HYN2_9PEZI|nr:hypothetical protein EJ06DRAFT_556420 [Trichodelitschia bisporula]